MVGQGRKRVQSTRLLNPRRPLSLRDPQLEASIWERSPKAALPRLQRQCNEWAARDAAAGTVRKQLLSKYSRAARNRDPLAHGNAAAREPGPRRASGRAPWRELEHHLNGPGHAALSIGSEADPPCPLNAD